MTKLQSLFENKAVNAMTLHAFAKEWNAAILAAWVLKFLTAAVAVYAGGYHLAELLSGVIPQIWAAFFVAMILLVLIETINATALFKGFKFIFRKRIFVALSALLVALFSFSVSFYISTEGIKSLQTEKADNTGLIESKSDSTLQAAKNETALQVSELKEAIQKIEQNPQGWQGGKRAALTSSQAAEISSLTKQIVLLRAKQAESETAFKTEKNGQIKEAKKTANESGAKYYNVVALLMIVQLFANFALAFFYSRIFFEKEQNKADREDLESFAAGLFANMFDDIKNRYANMQNHFANQSAQIFDLQAAKSFAHPLTGVNASHQTPPVNAPLTPSKQGGGIGFSASRTQSDNAPVNQNVQSDNTPQNNQKEANYYFTHRPQLCDAIQKQARGESYTSNRVLAETFDCSEATVRNCRRAIIDRK